MNIGIRNTVSSAISNIKTLFSVHDDKSYLNDLTKAVKTVDPSGPNSADELYKAIKTSIDKNYKKSLYKAYFLFFSFLALAYFYWRH